MKVNDFEILSVEDMRKKYGLLAANRPEIKLDPDKVPEKLRHLIPYAEFWGINDDLIREDLVKQAPPEAILELKKIIDEYDDLLDEWLAGPSALSSDPCDEYLAFSCMRLAADSCS